ncbi:MAG TPA: AmmeMemoRadiSam system radical SAM enzyme, partial [Planctomycetaceae bacterium]|nr:AmmeMemoRadiSam system radical SAM enzyme [Planctomycetaceae bacterium]
MLELARGKISTLKDQLSVWQIAGLNIPAELIRLHDEAFTAFAQAAVIQDQLEECSELAGVALQKAHAAAEMLVQIYARQRLTILHQRSQSMKLPVSLGCNLGEFIPNASEGKQICQAFDAANIDLKAFTEEFYYRITLSHLQPVLETLKWLKQETDVWFEITNLVIPQANDNDSEFQQMCDWILKEVGPDVPLHFSAFHPDFRMRDRGGTPPETLVRAREIALAAGLKYVYTGNVNDVARQSTYCPHCQQTLIERNWYQLGKYALRGHRCGYCDTEIAGHFSDKPGDWGQKRLPVDIQAILKKNAASQSGNTEPQKGPSTMQTNQSPQIIELSSDQEQALLQQAAAVVAGTVT